MKLTLVVILIMVEAIVGTRTYAQECIDPDLNQLQVGVKIMLCDGTIVEGKKVVLPTCSQAGQTNCMARDNFKAAMTESVSDYDIRAGKTYAGIVGKFKLPHCRSGVLNSLYNQNSAAPGMGAGNQTGGTDTFDWWDTVDYYGNGTTVHAMNTAGAAWTSDYFCDGSQIREVTGTAANLMPGGAVNCAATTCTMAQPVTKIFYDEYTKLYLTNTIITSAAGASPANSYARWDEAVSMCHNLNTGDGTQKWRLPTQIEAMLLHVGGLYSWTAEFNTLAGMFYTATTNSSSTDQVHAWGVANGVSTTYGKGTGQFAGVICVR